jgi:hypothetical protein
LLFFFFHLYLHSILPTFLLLISQHLSLAWVFPGKIKRKPAITAVVTITLIKTGLLKNYFLVALLLRSVQALDPVPSLAVDQKHLFITRVFFSVKENINILYKFD